MLNTGNTKKKLIIVYDEKCKSYANHLMQLIGMKDDNGEEVIGVKDETLKAVMWDEKKYRDIEMTITSDEKLVFIGRSKITKIINQNAEKKYSRHGIEYGWLGNRAVITVNKNKFSKNDYKKFISEAQLSVKQFEEKMKQSDQSHRVLSGGEVEDIFGVGVFTTLVLPVLERGVLISAVLKAKRELAFKNEARKQRINFAVLKFYYDHLSEFIAE